MKVWPIIRRNIDRHGRCALVTVVATQGSAPRDAGAWMVVTAEGYPGSMLDFAYLPDGSPLIGHVVGSAQDARITALDRVWRQISYHPHNGGGGPAWNPTKHGLHTSLGVLLSWLFNAK